MYIVFFGSIGSLVFLSKRFRRRSPSSSSGSSSSSNVSQLLPNVMEGGREGGRGGREGETVHEGWGRNREGEGIFNCFFHCRGQS